MNRYFYMDRESQAVIMIMANRRPSDRHKRGIWCVYEYFENKWHMPCFPEITWEMLKKMIYIGKISIKEET